MEIVVEVSRPMEHFSKTKSNPVYALLLFGLVSLTLISILSVLDSVLLATMSSPRFLFAASSSVICTIGATKCHTLFKALRMGESQSLTQYSISSSEEIVEVEHLGSSISSNNVGSSISTVPDKVLTPLRKDCEEPISFFILDEGGLRIASIDFCRRERVDENLVAGFLSAIQVFSDEVFAQNIREIRLEEYTLLVKLYPPFTFVYVFRGSVDIAEGKLEQIITNLSETPREWSAIVDSRYTGRVLSEDTRFAVELMVRSSIGTH